MKGVPVLYEPDNLGDARDKLAGHLYKHAPNKPFDGPLQVTVTWLFLTKEEKKHGLWKTTRPDAHNLNKLLFDVMEDLGFWEDDAQIAHEIIQKFWTFDMPGILINIEKLTEQ